MQAIHDAVSSKKRYHIHIYGIFKVVNGGEVEGSIKTKHKKKGGHRSSGGGLFLFLKKSPFMDSRTHSKDVALGSHAFFQPDRRSLVGKKEGKKRFCAYQYIGRFKS